MEIAVVESGNFDRLSAISHVHRMLYLSNHG